MTRKSAKELGIEGQPKKKGNSGSSVSEEGGEEQKTPDKTQRKNNTLEFTSGSGHGLQSNQFDSNSKFSSNSQSTPSVQLFSATSGSLSKLTGSSPSDLSGSQGHHSFKMSSLCCSLQERNRFYRKSKQGFTMQQRRECWMTVTGANQAMLSNSFQYYSELVQYCKQLQKLNFPYPAFDQIKKDMPRTFPDESFFNHKSKVGQQTLPAIERICQAYAIRNTQISYCQGFNFVVGRLLQVLSEEESFWLFTQLLETTYFTLDYFQLLVGAQVDQYVMTELLRQALPQLMDHFDQCQFWPGTMITFQWFTSLFSYNFGAEIVIRLWDAVFIKGDKMLFRIALAIFHLLQPKLLQQRELAGIRQIIESIAGLLQDASLILQVADMKQYKVSGEYIEHLRNKFRKQVIEQHEKSKEKAAARMDKNTFLHQFSVFKGMQSLLKLPQNELIQQINCDKNWSMCMLDQTQGNVLMDFFVYKQGEEYNMIEDYFRDETTVPFSNDNLNIIDRVKQLDQLRIKKPHNTVVITSIAEPLNDPDLDELEKEILELDQLNLSNIQIDEQQSLFIHQKTLNKQLLISRSPHFCNYKRLGSLKQILQSDDEKSFSKIVEAAYSYQFDCQKPCPLIQKNDSEFWQEPIFESLEQSIQSFCELLD